MNDQSPTGIHRPLLPAFSPVPREKDRTNGWKPEVQRAFIEALAETGSVASACRRVNRADHGAYLLRRHPEAEEFRAAWEAALALGVQRLEDVAMERALNGVEVPVYHFGEIVGTRRVYNDRLLMFILRNRAPKRFAADSYHNADAATKAHLERLKAEWRKQWEAERVIETRESSQATIKKLDAKLDLMRQRRLAMMSPRTRELLAAFEAAKEADRTSGYHPDIKDEEEDDEEEDTA